MSTMGDVEEGVSFSRLLKEWVKKLHPDCIANDEIILPLPVVILQQYFGEMCRWRQGAKQGQLKSFAAVNGYRNAIKYLYVERRIDSREFDEFVWKDTGEK